LSGTNALAYYKTSKITVVKSFITSGPAEGRSSFPAGRSSRSRCSSTRPTRTRSWRCCSEPSRSSPRRGQCSKTFYSCNYIAISQNHKEIWCWWHNYNCKKFIILGTVASNLKLFTAAITSLSVKIIKKYAAGGVITAVKSFNIGNSGQCYKTFYGRNYIAISQNHEEIRCWSRNYSHKKFIILGTVANVIKLFTAVITLLLAYLSQNHKEIQCWQRNYGRKKSL
jgi:hypothetical protein